VPHGPNAVLVGRFPMARRARLMLLAGRKPSPSRVDADRRARIGVPSPGGGSRGSSGQQSGTELAGHPLDGASSGSALGRQTPARTIAVDTMSWGTASLEEHGVGRWEDSGTISRIDPEDRRGSGRGALGDGQPRGRRDVRLHAPAGARTAKRRLSVSSTLSRPECCPTDRDRSPLCGPGRAD